MTFAVIALAVSVVLLLVVNERDRMRCEAAARAWTVERRELLNRIQRPEVVPLTPRVSFQEPDHEPDEIELVGTIKYEPDEE